MKTSLLIRVAATLAALSLVVVVSNGAIQASDVESVGQTIANAINAHGLGSSLGTQHSHGPVLGNVS